MGSAAAEGRKDRAKEESERRKPERKPGEGILKA